MLVYVSTYEPNHCPTTCCGGIDMVADSVKPIIEWYEAAYPGYHIDIILEGYDVYVAYHKFAELDDAEHRHDEGYDDKLKEAYAEFLNALHKVPSYNVVTKDSDLQRWECADVFIHYCDEDRNFSTIKHHIISPRTFYTSEN